MADETKNEVVVDMGRSEIPAEDDGVDTDDEDNVDPSVDDDDEEQPEEEPAPAEEPAPEEDKTGIVTINLNDPEYATKRAPGETPREFGLRKELQRQRSISRQLKGEELVHKTDTAPSTHDDIDLSEYDPEQIKVLEAVAKKMGLVSKNDLVSERAANDSNAVFKEFIDAHAEYHPENDPEDILWGRLKEEYALYKIPTDPKQLRKILEKAHNEVMGIQPVSALPKNDAGKVKVASASHAPASKPSATTQTAPKKTAPSGINRAMLKGFSEEELTEMGI